METLKNIANLTTEEVEKIFVAAAHKENLHVHYVSLDEKGNYEAYVRYGRGNVDEYAKVFARDLSASLECKIDYSQCEGEYDFYLIIENQQGVDLEEPEYECYVCGQSHVYAEEADTCCWG